MLNTSSFNVGRSWHRSFLFSCHLLMFQDAIVFPCVVYLGDLVLIKGKGCSPNPRSVKL